MSMYRRVYENIDQRKGRLQAGDCFVRGPCWVQVEGPSAHHKVCLMFLPFTARSSLTTWISTSLHASIRHKPPFRARGYRFLRCRRPNRDHKENDADFFLPERYAKIRYNEAAFLMFRKLTQMIAAQFKLRRFKIIVANPLTAMAESRMNLSQRFKVKFHIRQVEIN